LIVGDFVTVASALAWLVLKATVGLRVSEEAEIAGLARSELGKHAYPEFTGR
jgi:Amt family ammonium transporter